MYFCDFSKFHESSITAYFAGFPVLPKGRPKKKQKKNRGNPLLTSVNFPSSSKFLSSSCLSCCFCWSYIRTACSARCRSFSSFISSMVSRLERDVTSWSVSSRELIMPEENVKGAAHIKDQGKKKFMLRLPNLLLEYFSLLHRRRTVKKRDDFFVRNKCICL